MSISNPSGSSNNSVQSVDRLLDIIEVLSAHPQGLSLSDLAGKVKLHVSTAHRLLASLASRGYVVKDVNTKNYRLTLRMFAVSQRVSGLLDLMPASEVFLNQLSNHVNEAVHLVERSGNAVVYLYKTEPYMGPIYISSNVGGYNPMYITGVGKSILAYLPEKEVRSIWESEKIRKYTDNTITTLDALFEDLAKTRKRGYAIDNEEHDKGVRCVAAPIFNWEEKPVGAISISASASRLTDKMIKKEAPILMQTANEISKLQGYIDSNSRAK